MYVKNTAAMLTCCSLTHVGDLANLAGSLQIVSVLVCSGSFSHGDLSLPKCDNSGYKCNNSCPCRYLFIFKLILRVFFVLFFFRSFDICFADINITCLKDSVIVTWNITSDLVPYANRLFLGSCMPSKLQVFPTGNGEAQFNYPLSRCKFVKRVMKMLNLSHSSTISILFNHFSADEGKIHPL